MKLFFRFFLCWVLTVSLLLPIYGCKEKQGSESETSSEILYEDSSDWADLASKDHGTGKREHIEDPKYYVTPLGYYEETSYEKITDGMQKLAYGVKLTELSNKTVMTSINQTLQSAQKALREDFSWVNEESIAKITVEFGKDCKVIPTNYSNLSLTVYGNVLSATLQYVMLYNIEDAEGRHMDEIDADEGRYLYNFDLSDGHVVSLSDIFYEDIDYISLLIPYLERIGREMNYPSILKIDSLPTNLSTFALTEGGLAIGFPEKNPFTGIECWYVIDLSDIKSEVALDPLDAYRYFDSDVQFEKSAFEVKNIRFVSSSAADPLSGEAISLPLVDGISCKENVNRQLEEWYSQLCSTAAYDDAVLSAGGTLNFEICAPAGVINVTAFIYRAYDNQTFTIGRVFSAKNGQMLTVNSFLTEEGKKKAADVIDFVNFRVGQDFSLAIPEQTGISDYLIFDEDEVNTEAFFS